MVSARTRIQDAALTLAAVVWAAAFAPVWAALPALALLLWAALYISQVRATRRSPRTVYVTLTADPSPFKAQMDRLADQLRGIFTTVGERIAPAFQALADDLGRFADQLDVEIYGRRCYCGWAEQTGEAHRHVSRMAGTPVPPDLEVRR